MYELLKSPKYSIEDGHNLVGYVKFDSMRDAIYDYFDNRKTLLMILFFYYSGHGRNIGDGNECRTSSETDYYVPTRRRFSSYELIFNNMRNRLFSYNIFYPPPDTTKTSCDTLGSLLK